MNDDRLALSQIALLLAYVAGMSGGQLLFKAAALRYIPDGPMGERLLSLVANAYFLGAVVLYGGLTVLWVWVLTFTPCPAPIRSWRWRSQLPRCSEGSFSESRLQCGWSSGLPSFSAASCWLQAEPRNFF